MVEIPSMKNVLHLLGRTLLGLVFIFAGASKFRDPSAFAISIGHYHLLPYPLIVFASVYLPALEIICGLTVLFGRWCYRGALFNLAILCALFSAALVSAWMRGLDIDCGCFGAALKSSLPVAMLRSLGMGATALLLLVLARDRPSPANISR